tara:strand:+ start:970 stop:2223 length:1254 start_codon:yes stop_codon:yes gene_type:complete
MAQPTLTPSSNTSVSKLPVTGTAGDVASALPFGIYSSNTDFLSGAAEQVAYTYKKLGGDVLDIELKASNVYANYEEAVLEYSYLINTHQAKNVLSDVLGATTGTFDHDGSLKTGPEGINLKFPRFEFAYARRVADAISTEAGSTGGTLTEYSASFSLENGVQDYDLQTIISASADESASDFYNLVGNNKVQIRRVYYISPRAMWRFYGYYGGVSVVGNMNTYGQFADDSTFEIIPTWQNKMQAMTYEDSIYTRTSHYSYEIINNKLRLYPVPQADLTHRTMWVSFTVQKDPFEEYDDRKSGIEGVNNMNTIPFDNVPYENINAIGKQWIRRFALALSKETLGQIRGKFATLPIPGDNVTLNHSELLSQAKEEQEKLRTELKEVLDQLTYTAIMEDDAKIADAASKINTSIPMKIYVG